MRAFLLWIGLYNVLGALVVPGFFSEAFGDRLLRSWLQVVTDEYDHGKHGPVWVFWAASSNLFLGVVMVLATRWPVAVQREVAVCVIGVYAIGIAALFAALRSRRYDRRGIVACLVLWVAQIGWGAWALRQAT